MTSTSPRLGFFTRLLDDVGPTERYRLATEQIAAAERAGFNTAWVAQHHLDGQEGGLPAPFVLLAHVAARTARIGLVTGVVVLPTEDPLRVAEDAAVLDQLAPGRLEVGFGTGGNPTSFAAFGRDVAAKRDLYDDGLARIVAAWRGEPLATRPDGAAATLYPAAPQLADRIWEATFSAAGAARIGARGNGLLLSRTQPRPEGADPALPVWQVQEPVVQAYLDALPAGVTPRIGASRTVFVADDGAEARRWTEAGLRTVSPFLAGGDPSSLTLDELAARTDTAWGGVDQVLERLEQDTVLRAATDIVFQVHSVDPPHELVLRSIELIASHVAPALGWRPDAARADAGTSGEPVAPDAVTTGAVTTGALTTDAVATGPAATGPAATGPAATDAASADAEVAA